MMQRSDRQPNRRQRFLLFVVGLILFALGGCLRTPTPWPTYTLYPTYTPYPTYMPPPTSGPAAAETATPMPLNTFTPTPRGETLDVPLGIGIWDASAVEIFTKYAREHDVISARPPFLHLLKDVKVGRKMLNFNPRDEPLTDVESTISEAKALGVTLLGYNLETALDLAELVRKEQEVETAAKDAELIYAFGPTIIKLMRYYQDFAPYADVLVLQSQRFQTTDQYEETVEELIEKIKAANPEVEVWVMVMVRPRVKPDATADEVISDIQLIADKADLIWLFFMPNEVPALEVILRRLRQ